MNKIFIPIPVEQELPPYPQIVVVLIDSRLTMMAQIRPSETGPEWWTLGMSQATRIEENKKCVTHWLKPVDAPPTGFTLEQMGEAINYGFGLHDSNIDYHKRKQTYLSSLKPQRLFTEKEMEVFAEWASTGGWDYKGNNLWTNWATEEITTSDLLKEFIKTLNK